MLMLLYWPGLAQRYPPASHVERVQRAGMLRVAVAVDPGIDHAAFQDLHHMLLREFANRLDVTLVLVEADSQVALLSLLSRDEVDIAVPRQPLPEPLPQHLWRAPTYADSQTHFACHDATQPHADLLDSTMLRRLRISAIDGYTARLAAVGVRRISLAQTSPLGTVALLEQVAAGEFSCTLAQRDEIERARQRLPTVQLADALGPPGGIGWVLRNTRDDSLIKQVERFFLKARTSGLLAQLREQERGLRRRFEVVDLRGFRLAVATKLPRYEAHFRRAGTEYGIDWRLLAALGYQESRWNPLAESPRGPRGLMMLTAATARATNATDRLDPRQSIAAGALYFSQLRDTLTDEVPEPDRTWLTLAAYNLGPYALARARQVVLVQGGNPNRWSEVRRVLPTLRRGTRAWEPVFHVESVRRYFALLSIGGTGYEQGLSAPKAMLNSSL